MKKILVIGSPGSGKSTFAREISKKTNIVLYHMDKLHWYGKWKSISKEELLSKIEKIVEKDSWIIDGNYSSSLEIRVKNADTIFYFDYPSYICLFRIIKRYFMYRNKNRSDMPNTCKEKIDPEFYLYTLNFKKRQKKRINDIICSNFSGESLFIMKNKRDYKQVKKWLNENSTLY